MYRVGLFTLKLKTRHEYLPNTRMCTWTALVRVEKTEKLWLMRSKINQTPHSTSRAHFSIKIYSIKATGCTVPAGLVPMCPGYADSTE